MTTPFLRFDFADTLGLPGPVCFAQPERVIVAHDVSEVIAALRAVEEGTRQGFYAAGYVGYEAAPAFDDALVTWEPATPALRLRSKRRTPPSRRSCGSVSSARLTRRHPRLTRRWATMAAPSWRWEPDITPEDYRAGIDAVKEAIARGDTYQVNYTFRLRSDIAMRRSAASIPARSSSTRNISSISSSRGAARAVFRVSESWPLARPFVVAGAVLQDSRRANHDEADEGDGGAGAVERGG